MGNDTKKRLATTATFLVLVAASSRVLGLLREIVMVTYLGLGPDMGAFTVANKVPNLVRSLLADTALTAAFIPVFTGLLEKERRREAWQVAFTITVTATAILSVVTILGMVFAPEVVKVVAPGFSDDPEIVDLTIYLMRVMFPSVIIMGIAAIFAGILNSYDHFTIPALAPIVWNLVIIIAVVTFWAGYGVKALAWSFLVGCLIELGMQVPGVWKRRWKGEGATKGEGPSIYRLDLRSPEVRRVGILIGPVILSLGVINFNAFIDTVIATLISIPAPAIIDKAFRLFLVPNGIFAVAIGTVLFPALSRHAAGQRMKEFRDYLSLGLRQIFFMTLPFAALFAVLALPTVRLIYEHGKVTPEDSELVAYALTFFAVGMAFVSINTLLNRAFYSIQKPWLPLMVGAVNLALNAGLDLLLYKSMGVGGITLSTSLVSMFNSFALMMLLSSRIGGIGARRIAWTFARSIIALIPLSVVAYGVWWGLDSILPQSIGSEILSVGLAYLLGGAAYCLAAWAMRMTELRDVINLARRRREPRSTEEVVEVDREV
jgi:putative peptidoglycan lipid II flippase